MRNFHIIANWKMQLGIPESRALARETVRLFGAQAGDRSGVSLVVCPSYTAIDEVREELAGTAITLGGQNCFWENAGAYTGEVSPLALKQEGCAYCLVGHSERRLYLGETDEMVARKVRALLDAGLTPIVCVGETREEREAGRRDSAVIGQVRAALKGLPLVGSQRVIVAYEPRWVIGSGQAVRPEEAAAMHQLIRETLSEIFPMDVASRQLSVVYGGAVDSGNIAGFLDLSVVDGCLIGGASLRANSFVKMAEIAADLASA